MLDTEGKEEGVKELSQEWSSGLSRETGLIRSTEDRWTFVVMNVKENRLYSCGSSLSCLSAQIQWQGSRVGFRLAWDFPRVLDRGRRRQR